MKNHFPLTIKIPFGWLIIPFVLVGWVATSQAQIKEIKWGTDLSAALQQAKSNDKLVLLHFNAGWSKKSQDLKTFVFKNSRVVRAIESNVIPLMIDVDQFPELAREYGVEEVPYDLVLTPGRRVVARRSSPSSSDNYALMIEKLDRTIQLIKEKGLGAVDKNVDGLHELVATSQQVKQHHSFAAEGPKTSAFSQPSHASELSRKSDAIAQRQGNVIANQHFGEAELVAKSRPQQIVPSAESATLVQQREVPSSLKIINNKFFQSNDSTEIQNQLTASTMTPNLVSVPLKQDLEAKIKLADAKESGPVSSDSNPDSATAEFGATQASGVSLTIDQDGGNETTGYLAADVKLDVSPLALKGHCPVTLIKEKRWVKGKQDLGCFHRDRLYLFASSQNQKEFLDSPDLFSPLLAGYDPVVFDNSGQLVLGKEEHGAFLGNPPNFRVILFSSQETRAAFEANPRKYLETVRTAMQQAEAEADDRMFR